MKSNFHFKSSGELYSKITDGTHDSPKRTLEGKFLITSKHIKGREIDFSSAYLISEEDFKKINERSNVDQWDVIVSMIGEYCGFCYVERNATIDYAVKNVGLIKTGSKLEAEWLYYYLSSEIGKAHILALKSGSSQPYLTLGALRNFPVLVFEDDADKTGLVKVLSDLDAKIEVNNQINQQLEAMAKTLYDYWFVQFDFPFDFAQDKPSNVSSSAVENDLTTENPKSVSTALDMTAVKGYKSAGGTMVYNEELKREIPDGWEVKPLKEELDLQYGFPFSTKLFNNEEDGVAVIRIRDIKNCSISNYSTEEVDEKYRIEKGDILVGMDGNFHINYWIREDCYLNQRCLRIRPTIDSISAMQAKYMIEPYIKAREQNVSRTTVAHLSARDVNDLNVIIAPFEIQSKANKIFKSYLDKMVSNQVENQKLTELRDWLLPMLMNGQVQVDSSDAGDVDGGLGMVAESGMEYKKGK